MDRVPGLLRAEGYAAVPDIILRDPEDLAQVQIGETVFLCLEERFV